MAKFGYSFWVCPALLWLLRRHAHRSLVTRCPGRRLPNTTHKYISLKKFIWTSIFNVSHLGSSHKHLAVTCLYILCSWTCVYSTQKTTQLCLLILVRECINCVSLLLFCWNRTFCSNLPVMNCSLKIPEIFGVLLKYNTYWIELFSTSYYKILFSVLYWININCLCVEYPV